MDIEGTFVTSNSVRLWSERFGDPENPAVLLIMGTSTPGMGWPEELIQVLVDAGLQVLRFDHRDTGRSTCVDFATHPYGVAEMAEDALAVLDGHGIDAAHVVGASLGGAIAQWLAVHRPERVLSLSAIMSAPMGHDSGPAWARAFAGQPPDPNDLPPPSPAFLRHLQEKAGMPQSTRDEVLAANVETWRVLNGDALPFDEEAARRLVADSYDQAADPSAAINHDQAGRRMTDDRRAPLSRITAPTLVVHGTADPLLPQAYGEALAAQIPHARLHKIEGMGHGFFSPGLPARVGRVLADHIVPLVRAAAS